MRAKTKKPQKKVVNKLTPLQKLILNKLKIYRSPKTSREIFDVLVKAPGTAGLLYSMQQMGGCIRSLEDAGYIFGNHNYYTNDPSTWYITSRGRNVLAENK